MQVQIAKLAKLRQDLRARIGDLCSQQIEAPQPAKLAPIFHSSVGDPDFVKVQIFQAGELAEMLDSSSVTKAPSRFRR